MERGHVGAVNVEAQLKVVPTLRPVQSLAKLPLEFPRKSRSIGGVSQQKASNRKQQSAGKFGINKAGRGSDLIVAKKADM